MPRSKHPKIPVASLANLGARIREARLRAGYNTPGEFCNAIKEHGGTISRQYVRSIELGQVTPSFRKLKWILDACGVTPRDFLGVELPEREHQSVLATRVRLAREAAGYHTPSALWKAIRDRGGKIDRPYVYRLESGKQTASLEKLRLVLDACGVRLSDFLGTDLALAPRGDTTIEERRLLSMLNKIRAIEPSVAQVLQFMITTAFKEASRKGRGGS